MKGIDVSTFNGEINWCDMKDAVLVLKLSVTNIQPQGKNLRLAFSGRYNSYVTKYSDMSVEKLM